MFRKDYLLRMMEEMTEAIGKVFTLKQQRKHTEALSELDELLRRQFGLNLSLLNSLPAEDVIEMFRFRGVIEVDNLQHAARLIEEEAYIYNEKAKVEGIDDQEKMESEDEALIRLMRSLHFYLYALNHGANPKLLDAPGRVEGILEQTKLYELPARTEKQLALYREQQGRYDQAENSWYRLLQVDDNHPIHYRGEVQAFYERLRQLEDEQLQQGGLPREEVEEGLAELNR
ncbi:MULTISPECIES: DUF6483 family protein [unclassified Paenibacillus]|uniref:DUF6483 family protein n=1 Tax=unclassified Paenibacillus TaxID=185978 RepID=UPI0008C54A22|nr:MULTISPECIES: DUF6483 family protein [unclassified Paenibacillus]QLG38498.1 hypothetical protein HW560_10480 [Paenibacillus sp. E222]SEP19994.1 hypothetical protein SAMN05518670_6002 [Paenibacillus sp. OK076]